MRFVSASLAVGLAECLKSKWEWAADSRTAAFNHDLRVLSLVDVDYGSRVDLFGYTAMGTSAGKFTLPMKPSSIAVSPDGDWLGWCNWSAFAEPVGQGDALRVSLVSSSQRNRVLKFESWSGGPLAISAKAERVALITSNARTHFSNLLLLLDGTTGEIEQDLTGMVNQFPLARASRIGMSASGLQLIVGSGQSFIVIDLASQKTVYRGPGLFCSLSPDGQFVASLNPDKRISVVALQDQRERILLKAWTRISGIGAWTPDSRYLLAGVDGLLSKTLFAVDVAANRATDLMPIRDLAGDRYVWIKKSFLSGTSVLN